MHMELGLVGDKLQYSDNYEYINWQVAATSADPVHVRFS